LNVIFACGTLFEWLKMVNGGSLLFSGFNVCIGQDPEFYL